MPNSAGWPARSGWLAAFLVPPAITSALWPEDVAYHPLLAAVLIVLYEACVLVVRFATGVAISLMARWQERATDRVDRALRCRVSGFGRQYRKVVLASLRFIDLKGLATVGPCTPELDEVFVDVSLIPRPPHLVSTSLLADLPPVSGERRALCDFLDGREPARLAVIGAPGSGKTTLLRHTARHVCMSHAERQHRRIRLPVLLYLRDHATAIGSDPDITLTDLLRSTLGRLRAAEPDGWFEQRLRHGQCVVLLDGLDEVARQEDRKSVARWVERQIRQFPDNDYVITSRPQGYRAAEIEGALVLQARSFTMEQVDRFVQGWYLAAERHSTGTNGDDITRRARSAADDLLKRLDGTPALYELAANPLLLTMIANVHRYRGALPGSRVDLYTEICQVMLWRRQEAKQIVTRLAGDKKEVVLRGLAYAMMQRRLRDLPLDDLCDEIKPALRRLPQQIEAEDFLADVVSNGLLVERESGLFCFAHLTFQEYLAAEHIREKGLAEELCKVIGDPWWRETTLLYAARADADPIISACLRHGSVAALALAFDCASQGSEFAVHLRKRLESILVTGPDFAYMDAERRFLIAGIRLTRHLRQQIRTQDGARLCTQPIAADLYLLFQMYKNLRMPAGWVQTTGAQPAFVMHAQDVTAFIDWVNWTIGGEPDYRLPSSAALNDPAVQRLLITTVGNSPLPCVWISDEQGGQPTPWVPDGAQHPHEITDATLTSHVIDDITCCAPRLLIDLLVLRSGVLIHNLLRSTLGHEHIRRPGHTPRLSLTYDSTLAHNRALANPKLEGLRV